MAKAYWNDTLIAESDTVETVEGNLYFPMESLQREYFTRSETTSVCSWKGTAKYFTLEVNGQTNTDAAWYYPDIKPEAKHIENYVAFWKGIKTEG